MLLSQQVLAKIVEIAYLRLLRWSRQHSCIVNFFLYKLEILNNEAINPVWVRNSYSSTYHFFFHIEGLFGDEAVGLFSLLLPEQRRAA